MASRRRRVPAVARSRAGAASLWRAVRHADLACLAGKPAVPLGRHASRDAAASLPPSRFAPGWQLGPTRCLRNSALAPRGYRRSATSSVSELALGRQIGWCPLRRPNHGHVWPAPDVRGCSKRGKDKVPISGHLHTRRSVHLPSLLRLLFASCYAKVVSRASKLGLSPAHFGRPL